MNKLIVLGTGNAAVTKCYNTCFIINNGKENLLVDAGGGNQILTILENKNIKLSQIKNIILTHAHTDHLLGMIWVIRMIAQEMLENKYEGNLNIYVHKKLKEKLITICKLTLPQKQTDLFDKRIIFIETENEQKEDIMGYEVTFFDIYSTKESQYGFQIKYDNKKLTCLGDEPLNPKCEKFIQDVDWLLCEAFCLYDDREIFKPYEKYHSTVKDEAETAEKFGVKNLILWHTEDKDLTHRKEKYTKEAKKYFKGNVFVPNDLEEIEI